MRVQGDLELDNRPFCPDQLVSHPPVVFRLSWAVQGSSQSAFQFAVVDCYWFAPCLTAERPTGVFTVAPLQLAVQCYLPVGCAGDTDMSSRGVRTVMAYWSSCKDPPVCLRYPLLTLEFCRLFYWRPHWTIANGGRYYI